MGFWSVVNKVRDGVSNAVSQVVDAGNKFGDMMNDGYNKVANATIPGVMPVSWADLNNGVSSFWNSISGNTAAEQYREQTDMAKQQYSEQFNYLKEQNQLAMDRADNAYQRSVNDMLAAGINPLASSGGVQPAGVGTQGGSVGAYGASPTSQGPSASTLVSLIGTLLTSGSSSAMLAETNRHNSAMEEIARIVAGSGQKNAASNAQNAASNAKNADSNAISAAAAQANAESNAKNAASNAKNADTNALVGASTAGLNNAHADDLRYELDVKKQRGIGAQSDTEKTKMLKSAPSVAPSVYAEGKRILNMVLSDEEHDKMFEEAWNNVIPSDLGVAKSDFRKSHPNLTRYKSVKEMESDIRKHFSSSLSDYYGEKRKQTDKYREDKEWLDLFRDRWQD